MKGHMHPVSNWKRSSNSSSCHNHCHWLSKDAMYKRISHRWIIVIASVCQSKFTPYGNTLYFNSI